MNSIKNKLFRFLNGKPTTLIIENNPVSISWETYNTSSVGYYTTVSLYNDGVIAQLLPLFYTRTGYARSGYSIGDRICLEVEARVMNIKVLMTSGDFLFYFEWRGG